MKKMIAVTGLVPDKVTVKPMSASWGRCISNRHISINSKVIVFDRDCISYVCLHELCHLVHMNHSPEFWALVEKYCPDYKQIKTIMKN
jgi:predicted metal-dependent hydrolase